MVLSFVNDWFGIHTSLCPLTNVESKFCEGSKLLGQWCQKEPAPSLASLSVEAGAEFSVSISRKAASLPGGAGRGLTPSQYWPGRK